MLHPPHAAPSHTEYGPPVETIGEPDAPIPLPPVSAAMAVIIRERAEDGQPTLRSDLGEYTKAQIDQFFPAAKRAVSAELVRYLDAPLPGQLKNTTIYQPTHPSAKTPARCEPDSNAYGPGSGPGRQEANAVPATEPGPAATHHESCDTIAQDAVERDTPARCESPSRAAAHQNPRTSPPLPNIPLHRVQLAIELTAGLMPSEAEIHGRLRQAGFSIPEITVLWDHLTLAFTFKMRGAK